jgi:hypothetical protein
MILLISSLAQAQGCAVALQQATNEPVLLCAAFREALAQLESQDFSAAVFDQLLLDAEPDEAEAVLKHLGTAVPVYVNFAISGTARVARELLSALQRRKREILAAKKEAEQALRHELNDTVTALLLCCEMALQVPGLPESAESKLQTVGALARDVSVKLGVMA